MSDTLCPRCNIEVCDSPGSCTGPVETGLAEAINGIVHLRRTIRNSEKNLAVVLNTASLLESYRSEHFRMSAAIALMASALRLALDDVEPRRLMALAMEDGEEIWRLSKLAASLRGALGLAAPEVPSGEGD